MNNVLKTLNGATPKPLTSDANPDISASENGDDLSKERENDEASNANRESGGPKGLEPTRYGDWEKNGKCVDF